MKKHTRRYTVKVLLEVFRPEKDFAADVSFLVLVVETPDSFDSVFGRELITNIDVEDITYNKSEYSQVQRALIDDYIKERWDYIVKKAIG